MRAKCLLAAIAAPLSLLLGSHTAHAQSDAQKFEASAVLMVSRQSDDFYNLSGFEPRVRHNFGYGGRFGFNVTDSISLEAELTYHPKKRVVRVFGFSAMPDIPPIGGTRTQGLFGVKAGKRGERFGLFGKIRPGFMRYSDIPGCPGGDPELCVQGGKTEFAMDAGGVVEYYPNKRWLVRFDASDMMVFHDKLTMANFFNLPSDSLKVGGGVTNSAQYSFAMGVRF